MATLFIVATPIGNLGDITKRALEVLRTVDIILCEDTRNTKKLLYYFNIRTTAISYHQHSGFAKTAKILSYLKTGKDIALVSDSGTPGISDPGNKLVRKVSEELGDKVKIVPIPGPSALTAIVSVAGFPADKFLFLGFPPSKRKRKKFFEEVAKTKSAVVFFESPRRIEKTLNELSEGRQIVAGREITKIHETIYRGKPSEVLEKLKKDKIKGEFTIFLAPLKKQKSQSNDKS